MMNCSSSSCGERAWKWG